MVLTTAAECDGKFRVRWDESLGYISFELMGYASDDDGLSCFSTLNTLSTIARQRHGRMLLLVDASRAPVQAPALIPQMTSAAAPSVSPNDRIAFVVSSSLLKMQFKRKVDNSAASISFFTSASAAETWLLAEESKSAAAVNHAAGA